MVEKPAPMEGPESITVRAMVGSDAQRIFDHLDPDFDVSPIMEPMTVAFVAEAGGKPVAYMIYRLQGRKAVIMKCFTHPEFRHAAIDMIVGLMTGGVMEEMMERLQTLFRTDPNALELEHPQIEIVVELLKLRQQLKELAPSAFTGIRRRDNIEMEIEKDDPLKVLLEELGFDPAPGDDDESETVKMEYRAQS